MWTFKRSILFCMLVMSLVHSGRKYESFQFLWRDTNGVLLVKVWFFSAHAHWITTFIERYQDTTFLYTEITFSFSFFFLSSPSSPFPFFSFFFSIHIHFWSLHIRNVTHAHYLHWVMIFTYTGIYNQSTVRHILVFVSQESTILCYGKSTQKYRWIGIAW